MNKKIGKETRSLCRNLQMALGNNPEFSLEEQSAFLEMLRIHINDYSSDFQIGVMIGEGIVPNLLKVLDVQEKFPVEMQVNSNLN